MNKSCRFLRRYNFKMKTIEKERIARGQKFPFTWLEAMSQEVHEVCIASGSKFCCDPAWLASRWYGIWTLPEMKNIRAKRRRKYVSNRHRKCKLIIPDFLFRHSMLNCDCAALTLVQKIVRQLQKTAITSMQGNNGGLRSESTNTKKRKMQLEPPF